MNGFSDFQFVATISGIVVVILGAIAMVLNTFVKTRSKRQECIDQFKKIDERLFEEEDAMTKQQTAEQVAKLKFEFIEKELREIRDKQDEMNSKIDRMFEMIIKIPKRLHNGKEE